MARCMQCRRRRARRTSTVGAVLCCSVVLCCALLCSAVLCCALLCSALLWVLKVDLFCVRRWQSDRRGRLLYPLFLNGFARLLSSIPDVIPASFAALVRLFRKPAKHMSMANQQIFIPSRGASARTVAGEAAWCQAVTTTRYDTGIRSCPGLQTILPYHHRSSFGILEVGSNFTCKVKMQVPSSIIFLNTPFEFHIQIQWWTRRFFPKIGGSCLTPPMQTRSAIWEEVSLLHRDI